MQTLIYNGIVLTDDFSVLNFELHFEPHPHIQLIVNVPDDSNIDEETFQGLEAIFNFNSNQETFQGLHCYVTFIGLLLHPNPMKPLICLLTQFIYKLATRGIDMTERFKNGILSSVQNRKNGTNFKKENVLQRISP